MFRLIVDSCENECAGFCQNSLCKCDVNHVGKNCKESKKIYKNTFNNFNLIYDFSMFYICYIFIYFKDCKIYQNNIHIIKISCNYLFQGICKVPSIGNGNVETLLPQNADKVKDNFVVFGTKISIICDQNYILNKNSRMFFTCMNDGWDFVTTPICERMYIQNFL